MINISSEGSEPHAPFISQILARGGSLVCCVPAGDPSGSPTADPRSVLDLDPAAGFLSEGPSQTWDAHRTQKPDFVWGICCSAVVGALSFLFQ